MKLEANAWKFYQGLEEGKFYGRRCLECGAVEFPPHYACNTCGYRDTEWIEVSGNGALIDFVHKGPADARPQYEEIDPNYVFGSVRIDEGAEFNVVVFGVSKDNSAELREKLANGTSVPVVPKIVQRDGYKALYYQIA